MGRGRECCRQAHSPIIFRTSGREEGGGGEGGDVLSSQDDTPYAAKH